MNIQYLFSSPEGDVSLGPEDLARPFLLSPEEAHPFLTLEDYFNAIKAFILKDRGKPLLLVLKERLKKETSLDDIREILIRSEKHGVLYHLASIEILAAAQRIKLTVSTAVSENGKACLAHEYDILNFLDDSLNLSFLPKVYFKGEMVCEASNNKLETLAMLLSHWFESYHEWHLSIDQADNELKICIWDLEHGNRYASEEEAFEIFRQSSKILTLFYNTENFNQIYPWHHAAGDFIVRTRDGNIDVKLTTARRYGSIMTSFSEDTVNPVIAIIYFFLNLTIRMRLDKLDGVGETVWAGSLAMEAATKGFFEALGVMEAEGRSHPGQAEDLLSLLKSFELDELERLFHSLFSLYQEDDPADLAVIQKNLENHIRQFYTILHEFHV